MKFRYLQVYRDRHGRRRVYYRRNGVRVPLPSDVDSHEFLLAYTEVASRFDERQISSCAPSRRAIVGTLRWVCIEYFKSAAFKELSSDTQRSRRRVLEGIAREPWNRSEGKTFGDAPIDLVDGRALAVLRDRKAGKPEAARSRLKALSGLFEWAIPAGLVSLQRNPLRDVVYPKPKRGGGSRPWKDKEREQFERTHPVGTMPRLAYALLFYTCQRKSDVVVFGPHHVHDGWITFTQQKNAGRNPVSLTLPILPELQQIIDATAIGSNTFLVTKHGKPFSRAGFGARMRQWCNEAGLPKCSAHGLRKAGAIRLVDNGATDHELMAICGWRDSRQAQVYTRGADQRRMAAQAMPLLTRRKAIK